MAMAKLILGLMCVLGASALSQAADYRVFWNQSIPGNDLPCGQFEGRKDPLRLTFKPSTFCGVYGIVPAADACDANPECRGFDQDDGPRPSLLKTAAGQGKTVPSKGAIHYCKIGGGSNCTTSGGSYTFKRRAEITGGDIECGQKNIKGELLPYCELSVGPLVSRQNPPKELAAACDAHPKCKAFTYRHCVQNSRVAVIGRLKGADGPTTFYDSTGHLKFTFIKD